MSTFILIHGAAHGGWCWYNVRVGIVCTMDRSLTPGMQENMYKKAACEIRYLDSGHAPFFSRPEELAAMLLEE